MRRLPEECVRRPFLDSDELSLGEPALAVYDLLNPLQGGPGAVEIAQGLEIMRQLTSYTCGSLSGKVRIGVMTSTHRNLTEREKTALALYIPERDLENARLREGRVPWYLPARFVAITRGNRIWFRPGVCRTDTVDGLALMAHELAHVGQYRQGATWLSFILSYLRHGYRNSPLEIQARQVEARIRRELGESRKSVCTSAGQWHSLLLWREGGAPFVTT